MGSLFTININVSADLESVNNKLNHLLKHQHEIMGAIDDIKAQLAVSDEKIDILTEATAGVTQDVAFIKAKLDAAGPGGIDAAGVAELQGIINSQSERLTTVSQQLADLDASTDSTPEQENPLDVNTDV